MHHFPFGKPTALVAAAVVSLAAPFAVVSFARAQGPLVPPPNVPAVRPSRGDRAANSSRPKKRENDSKAPDAVRLFQRMVKTGFNRPFLAREITLTANGKETEQWVKWQPRKGVRVENIRPTPGDLLIDDFKGQYVFSAQTRRWTRRDSLLPKPQGRIGEVLNRVTRGELKAEWVGQDKVAGRVADIVRIGPPANVAAPARRIWIDRQSGLRLKMEEIGADGRTLASSYYVFIDTAPQFSGDDFAAPPEPALTGTNGGSNAPTNPPTRGGDRNSDRRSFRSLDEASQTAGVSIARPAYLPTGFALRVVEIVNSKTPTRLRVTQRYANGLTVLSLTQTAQKLPIPSRLAGSLGPNQTGFVTLRGTERAYVWRSGGSFFALIGNLPDDQLKRVADSVK